MVHLQKHASALHDWFSQHEAEMFEKLETLVNMDSFSSDGDDVNLVGECITQWMREAGFFAEKIPKIVIPADELWMESLGNVFTARTHPKEAGAGIIFLAHMDTVFPRGTVAERPFRMDIKADRAYGPGIIDMKAGLIVNIFVARALKELGLISTPMTLTFSPDEELGSPSTMPILAQELQKGLAAICTEPGYPGGGVTIERKGSGHFLLTIKGISSHAGRCYAEGASAILELAHTIIAYDKYVALERDMTVNTGIIEGGASANSVAPNAFARIHFTYKTLADGQTLAESLRKESAKIYVDRTQKFLSGGLRLPSLEPVETVQKLFALAQKAGEAFEYPIKSIPSKGAAESGFCSSVLNIPAICSMGPEGEFLHSKDEYLVPSSFIPRCKLVALTAMQAAKAFA